MKEEEKRVTAEAEAAELKKKEEERIKAEAAEHKKKEEEERMLKLMQRQ